METPLTKAQHYRDQAAKLRELAAKEDNLDARAALISLAETYSQLCQKLVDRVRSLAL